MIGIDFFMALYNASSSFGCYTVSYVGDRNRLGAHRQRRDEVAAEIAAALALEKNTKDARRWPLPHL
jgi:hypothetical protein